jgi:hypothetical protein
MQILIALTSVYPVTNFTYIELNCIFQVAATDPDCGVNAQVTYAIDTNVGFKYPSEFSIDNKTGNICIVKALDYETRQTYEFPVIARDAGKLSSIMVLCIIRQINGYRHFVVRRDM